jgi:hypothetical protein
MEIEMTDDLALDLMEYDGEPWIGVDLDGTLAIYKDWVGPNYIGEPIPAMLERVKSWIFLGKKVKIFTARCWKDGQVKLIQEWLKKHGLPKLEVTNIKDPAMVELWDDRCIQVVRNTGLPII